MSPPALHVDAGGDGPCVVLGHGLGGSARNWRPQLRSLRPRWRAVAFDARGHARSEAPRDPAAYRLECFVEDLARIVDEQSASPAVVGGLSMGAAVALAFALARPERVRGLVLAAYPAARGAGGFATVAEEFAASIEREGLEAAGARFVWGERSGLDPQAAQWVRQGFLEHAPHALAAILRELVARQPAVETLAPQLRQLALPALVVVGARDRGSLAPSRALAESLPEARLVVVEAAGHVVNLADPRHFDAALVDFLEELAPPGPGLRAR